MFVITVVIAILSVSTLTAGKTVNINIDFDDVLKIVNEFTNPEVLRRFASEVAQRAGVHQQIYKNPYHPEDDLAESIATLNMLQNKTKTPKDSENSVNKAIMKDIHGNSKSDAEIERNNIKYFTSKERSDDELTDSPSHIVNNHTDLELKAVNKTVIAKDVEPPTDMKKYDTRSDFKRRFVVVSPKSTIDPNINKDLREIKSLEAHYQQPTEADKIVDTNNDARKRILQSDPRPYSIENLKNNAPLATPVSFDPKIDIKEIKSLDTHYKVSHEADIIQVDSNSDPKQSIVKKSNPLPYSIENEKENAPITSKSIDLNTNKNLKDIKTLDALYKVSHEADIIQEDANGDTRKRIVKKSNPVPYSIEDIKDKAFSSKPTTDTKSNKDFKEIKFSETHYKQSPEAYTQVDLNNNTRKTIFTISNPLPVSTGDIKENKPLGANMTNIALGEIDRFHALRRRFEALNKFVENIVAKHKTPNP